MTGEELLEKIELLPHEERCTIHYSPLCDCARGLVVEEIQGKIDGGELK